MNHVNDTDPRFFPKRRFLKFLGGGLMGGSVAASAQATGDPLAQDIWTHAHALILADPEQAEFDLIAQGAKRLRGTSFGTSSLHVPVAVPFQPLNRINAVLLRFKTSPGAEISAVRLYDGETEVDGLTGLELRAEAWADHRLALRRRPTLSRGGSLSIDVTFAAVEREIEFSAVGWEISG